MRKIRRATERTIEPLELVRGALAELDLMVEAALFGFAWMHNMNDRMNGGAWKDFTRVTRMPFSMRMRFDLAMENTAEEAKKGFPILFGLGTVSLCGHLEAATRDLAHCW